MSHYHRQKHHAPQPWAARPTHCATLRRVVTLPSPIGEKRAGVAWYLGFTFDIGFRHQLGHFVFHSLTLCCQVKMAQSTGGHKKNSTLESALELNMAQRTPRRTQ